MCTTIADQRFAINVPILSLPVPVLFIASIMGYEGKQPQAPSTIDVRSGGDTTLAVILPLLLVIVLNDSVSSMKADFQDLVRMITRVESSEPKQAGG